MIEKIIITDDTMRILHTFKIELNGNPNIISSMFWLGKTLIYTKGTSISYFYGEDNINQKIFTNNLPSTFIAGVLPDRFILVSKGNKEIDSIVLTTPAINPLEPILIGYLDNPKLDYNLIKECVINSFTNQISHELINKFSKLDLKEVAWMFLSDSKSSFQMIDKKITILNDLLKFDMVLENIISNKDLKNEMHLDELIWRLNYDQSYENVKKILQKESNTLIQYGQFDKAVKILELLGDYSRALELLLISTSKEEYEKLRVMFQAKGCMNFSDNLLINNAFFLQYKPNDNNPYNMNHYSKIFDNYPNEHFIFGANQDKYNIKSIQGIENKLNQKNSYITNICKKILSFGETPFSIYVNSLNSQTGKETPCAVCNIVLQKIEHFYGYKNTVFGETITKGIKKADFHDYNVPLTQIQSVTHGNSNEEINQGNNEGDFDDNNNDDIDPNSEDINECYYLSAYYHCDKGSGIIVEDISDNGNDAMLSYIDTSINNPQSQIPQPQIDSDDNTLWTNVLDEFEPLEYEDKWGRRSPGAHSIRFNKKFQTKMKIKYSPSFLHLNSRFTIEMWVKLNSFNVTLLAKETVNLEIQNGQFKLNYQNNLLQGDKLNDYSLVLNQFFHLTIIYRKKKKQMKIYLNCEEATVFPITLDLIPLASDVIIGNGNLDAEITEVKIWNHEMPISFLRDNYKSPLPILAESKRKLRMKINKQDDNKDQPKKKFDFNKSVFQFGNESNKQNLVPIQTNMNNKEMYDFNPTNSDNEVSISYPNLSSVLDDSIIVKGAQFNHNNDNNNLQFGFKFDEVNNQNIELNLGENVNGNPETFNFQIDDFNFEK